MMRLQFCLMISLLQLSKKSTLGRRFVTSRTVCVFPVLFFVMMGLGCTENEQIEPEPAEIAPGSVSAPAEDAAKTLDGFDLSLTESGFDYDELSAASEHRMPAESDSQSVGRSSQPTDFNKKSKNKLSVSPDFTFSDDGLPEVSGAEITLERKLQD